MSIRIAVIGAGIMGSDHARIFAEEVPGATLRVVCDAVEERARRIADAFGSADIATEAEAVIARADVDAVVVASPDRTHTPLSLACIAAGKPVLCEKPLSQSPAECARVIAAEHALGRRCVQMGFMRRFDPSYVEMRAARLDGSIGRALMMHNFHRNVETPAADFTPDMAITNSAPHEFDVARFVLGGEFATMSAWAPDARTGKVGPVFMVLETRDAQLVTIEVNNNAAYGYDVRGELVGVNGAIALSNPVHAARDAALRHSTAYAADWRARFFEAYRRQNKAFLRFVRTGAFPPGAADAWDGTCAAVVAQAGVLALREGRKIAVELPAKPELYSFHDNS